MLTWFKADLHIHTCLSPCGDLTMSPRKIVTEALRQHIGILAITDHNSAENVPAVINAAREMPLVVLPGMEVCTQEEVHVLAIFDAPASAFTLQSLVYDHLAGTNDPEAFGLQVIANEGDEVEGFQERLLIGATSLALEEVVESIHQLNGLAVAAHIDRETYGVIGQLGFIPEGLDFDALEITEYTSDAEAKEKFGKERRFPFIRNSDAHDLHRVGANTICYLLAEPTLDEIRKAFRRQEGRTTGMPPGSGGIATG